jgi:hypothetical protein
VRFLIRLIVVAVICLVAVGLYRGWFIPTRDAQGDKVGVSVDVQKVKDDLKKAKQDIKQGVKKLEGEQGKEGKKPSGS